MSYADASMKQKLVINLNILDNHELLPLIHSATTKYVAAKHNSGTIMRYFANGVELLQPHEFRKKYASCSNYKPISNWIIVMSLSSMIEPNNSTIIKFRNKLCIIASCELTSITQNGKIVPDPGSALNPNEMRCPEAAPGRARRAAGGRQRTARGAPAEAGAGRSRRGGRGIPEAPGLRAPFTWIRLRLLRGAPALYERLSRLGLWPPLRIGQPNEQLMTYRLAPHPEIEKGWHVLGLVLRQLGRDVSDRGGRLLVVYVPSAFEVVDRSWDLMRIGRGMKEGEWDRTHTLRRLARFAKRSDTPPVFVTCSSNTILTEPLLMEGAIKPVCADVGFDSVSPSRRSVAIGMRDAAVIELLCSLCCGNGD